MKVSLEYKLQSSVSLSFKGERAGKDDLELFFYLTRWGIKTLQDWGFPRAKLQVRSKARILTRDSWCAQCSFQCPVKCAQAALGLSATLRLSQGTVG